MVTLFGDANCSGHKALGSEVKALGSEVKKSACGHPDDIVVFCCKALSIDLSINSSNAFHVGRCPLIQAQSGDELVEA